MEAQNPDSDPRKMEVVYKEGCLTYSEAREALDTIGLLDECANCGFDVKAALIPAVKNGDRTDSTIGNLEAICANCAYILGRHWHPTSAAYANGAPRGYFKPRPRIPKEPKAPRVSTRHLPVPAGDLTAEQRLVRLLLTNTGGGVGVPITAVLVRKILRDNPVYAQYPHDRSNLKYTVRRLVARGQVEVDYGKSGGNRFHTLKLLKLPETP